jgi:DNA-binding transcriptional ArsR family regulator
MSFGNKMVSTDFHVFVAGRRTNRLLLSRLKEAGAVELEEQLEMGTQHWKLSEEGKAWVNQNS